MLWWQRAATRPVRQQGTDDLLAAAQKRQVKHMSTPDHTDQHRAWEAPTPESGRFEREVGIDDDLVSGELLDNLTSTPLGRLLRIISHLPEIRQEKVVAVRRQIDRDEYALSENLDAALDRVLEELIAEE